MTDEITVDITSLGNNVGGISSRGGRKTVFVRGALPGEIVRCSIRREKKGFLEASPLEILRRSESRREPFCRYFGDCGGCSLQNLDYERQLFWKRSWIEKALSRADIRFSDEHLCEVIPSPSIKGYRNRVSFDISRGRPGLHRERGDVMEIDDCPLLNKEGQTAFSYLKGKQLDDFSRVSIRASDRTSEVMLEFSGSSPAGTSLTEEGYFTAWRENKEWMTDPEGSVLHERIGEITYPVRPGTFFQVNTDCAEIIVSIVTGLCESGNRILDLYGGCGTFALPLAAGKAEVTSVELNQDSSSAGIKAAENAGITGVDFVTCRARNYLLDTVRSRRKWDAVIADPPRSGLGIRISRLLRRICSERLIYVSCNPFSMARDLRILCDGGWAVARVQPVDMFPQTDHVETIVELNRKDDQ